MNSYKQQSMNSSMLEALSCKKPAHWFVPQISGLVFIWWAPPSSSIILSSPIILRESVLTSCRAKFSFSFFSICVFVHAYSQFAGQHGNGNAIFLYPNFYSLHRYWKILRVIAAEISHLLITDRRARTGNFWFPKASHAIWNILFLHLQWYLLLLGQCLKLGITGKYLSCLIELN